MRRMGVGLIRAGAGALTLLLAGCLAPLPQPLVGLNQRLEAAGPARAPALAGDPRLLLLDEPLGPLDRPLRAALLLRLAALRERLDLTVLHVTHDPEEALGMATQRIDLLAGGRLATGGPEQ